LDFKKQKLKDCDHTEFEGVACKKDGARPGGFNVGFRQSGGKRYERDFGRNDNNEQNDKDSRTKTKM
jgi:hypothetical protein